MDLSPQFTQLPMFMETKDIIDKFDKGDSGLAGTPRQQWEEKDPDYGMSLREMKLHDLATPHPSNGSQQAYFQDRRKRGTLPPVTLGSLGIRGRVPQLGDGHHRLAFAEANKVPFLPVKHV